MTVERDGDHQGCVPKYIFFALVIIISPLTFNSDENIWLSLIYSKFRYSILQCILLLCLILSSPYAKCWESLRGGPHVPTVSEDIQPSCGASTISHRSNHTPHPYFSSCSVPFVHRRLPSTKHWNQRQAGGETGFEHNITCGSPPKAALLRSLYGR